MLARANVDLVLDTAAAEGTTRASGVSKQAQSVPRVLASKGADFVALGQR